MCTTSISMREISRRLDAPSEFYKAPSPSSISEVDLRQNDAKSDAVCDANNCDTGCQSDKTEPTCPPTPSEPAAVAGDSPLLVVDGWSDPSAADLGDINADVSPAIPTSSTPRKRRFSDVIDLSCEPSSKRLQVENVVKHDVFVSAENEQPDQSGHESPSGWSSVDRTTDPADDSYDDDGYHSPALDIDCSAKPYSRRTLYIEYWSRTDECKERKWDHLDKIAENYGSAEEHIFATTLNGRTAFLEPNMFPYDTPAGIEHWTLWHVRELNHEQIKQYVENWIDANAPHVLRWNYDDNPERSIDIFHVHVYFQVGDGDSVLQGRKVEELMHECD